MLPRSLVPRILVIVCLIAVAFAGLVLQRWYSYVTNTETPFQEVGIDLNAMMPGPVQRWGCLRLKRTFGTTTLPPHGCSAPDGRGWLGDD